MSAPSLATTAPPRVSAGRTARATGRAARPDVALGAQSSAEPVQGRSVQRALGLIELLARAGRPLALSEIGARAGLTPSTCHHLLGTLVARGWARHDLRTRHYALGSRLAELAGGATAGAEIATLAMPALRWLNEACGEAVHLAEMQGLVLHTQVRLEAVHAVRVDTGAMAKSGAAHATATGKVLLACGPAARVEALLSAQPLARFTPRTLVEAHALRTELARVRQQGYALDDEEFQPGVVCIGAAVHGVDGAAIAAVSCSLPTLRAGRRNRTQVRAQVLECARRISESLGHRAPDARQRPCPDPHRTPQETR